jgi:hypothetical protein
MEPSGITQWASTTMPVDFGGASIVSVIGLPFFAS